MSASPVSTDPGINEYRKNPVASVRAVLIPLFLAAWVLTRTGGAQTNSDLVGEAPSSGSPCVAPAFSCARTDTAIIPLGRLPSWGGLIGAGTIFTEPSFNPDVPPKYARVTDSTSARPGSGLAYSSFSVGAGSGDDSHFNADDSLFWINDEGNNFYFYGLDATTLATGLVWYPDGRHISAGTWSQVNRNYFYSFGAEGAVSRFDLTGCHLGGAACSPPAPTVVYDFAGNCGLNPSISFHETANIGGGDTVFAATYSPSTQDTGDEVVSYNSTTNTCYFYNTRYGSIHSYTGRQTLVRGMIKCDGTNTISWASGAQFGTGSKSWLGLNITIRGANFEVAAIASATSLSTNASCPMGTWNYTTQPGVYLGTATTPDRYSIHNVKVDPSGTWLIVIAGTCYSGICQPQAWQIGTTTVNRCRASCGGHWTETASGWFNSIPKDGEYAIAPGIPGLFRTWANFSVPDRDEIRYLNNTPHSVSVAGDLETHPSAKNDPLGTHDYPIFSSTYAQETPAGAITHFASNEIVGWTQGGGVPRPLMRLGHTFNSGLEPISQFAAKFAIGAVSSTGKFYLFTTDGEGTLGSNTGQPSCSVTKNCRNDVFILDLAPPPAN